MFLRIACNVDYVEHAHKVLFNISVLACPPAVWGRVGLVGIVDIVALIVDFGAWASLTTFLP